MATKEHKRRRRTITDEQRKLLADIHAAERKLSDAMYILQAVTIPIERDYKMLQAMGYISRVSDLHGFNHQWRTTDDANEVLDE